MFASLKENKMKNFLTFLHEESESNKKELARINADRKAEGKPTFRTLDAALTHYEQEDERARRKKYSKD